MTNETVLTDEEIITLGQQVGVIEPGENGYILPVSFARAIEQAVLQLLPAQTSNTIRGDSYAGIYIWLDSDNITQHISKSLIENARDPQSMLEYVAAKSIRQLEQYNALQSPEVQAIQKDAERYRWLKEQFRVMSMDMGGNQVWVLKQPIASGQTMDAACDAAMEKKQ